ncbi:MAG TPA: hypothetical protein VMI56_21035 [Reyranella sp.]|nr:hypothetical protein [Reyranella sp.]
MRRLEAIAAFCLRAPLDDHRLGDLAELRARTEIALGHSLPRRLARLAADLRYIAATVDVMVFAALDLRETIMILLHAAVRRFALPALLLACSALMLSDALGVWDGWKQTEQLMANAQRDRAEAAARALVAYKGELERQIGWITFPFGGQPPEKRRYDYARLLQMTPAVLQLAELDAEGREQLAVNRYTVDVVASGIDRSADAAFVAARKDGHYVGPVHAGKNGALVMTLAFTHPRSPAGVTVLDLSVRPALDLVAAVKPEGGAVYIDDGEGRRLSPVTKGVAGPVRSVSVDVSGTRWKVVVDVPSAVYDLPERNAAIRALATAGLALVAAALAFLLALKPFVPARPAAA